MDSGGGRKQQYFIPGEGIVREVIQADVCKYLDNDATVRPSTFNGREGYLVYAYRNFTNEMITDLRNDSAKWLREKQQIQRQRPPPRGGPPTKPSSRGSTIRSPDSYSEPQYVNSDTWEMSEQRAQARRDGLSDTPVPQAYPTGRAPPPQGYSETPQPAYGGQYVAQPPPQSSYGHQSHPAAEFPPPIPDPQYPRGATVTPQAYPAAYTSTGYPVQTDQQYARGMEPPMANTSRPYQPGYSQGQEPPRDTYNYEARHESAYEARQEPIYEARREPSYDQRPDPRIESRYQQETRYGKPDTSDRRRRGR